MEEFLRLRRTELLQQGAPDSDSEDWDRESTTADEEDNSREEIDLAFITSILESFSKHDEPKEVRPTFSPPEGELTPADTKRVTPPKFNQNLTIKISMAKKFSCFPTTEDGGTEEFIDNEDIQSESDLEETEVEDHF
jgi:hypothetical protein